ncbi:MAG: FliA/WhiG family RNA polymerase sigma factor, partial [Actinobacteria bacterium]|nr:FliA/WhiG family RNA polymerase sigma factor [Actinomycetota bacterium]
TIRANTPNGRIIPGTETEARCDRAGAPVTTADVDLVAHYAPIFDDDRELAATWVAARIHDDAEARSALAATYIPLVRYVVSRMNLNLPPSLERGDLVGFGTIGLIDAISRFNMDLGLTFQTYAVTRIRGSILDELRSQDWVPRKVRSRMRAIDQATAAFQQEHGAEPSLDELAEATGLGRDEVQAALAGYQKGYLASLEARMDGDRGSDDEPRGRAFVDETAELPEEIYDHQESQQVIRDQIRNLPDRDRAVIALYYFEELTFAQIGRALGVSESRACQIHGHAIRELRTAV